MAGSPTVLIVDDQEDVVDAYALSFPQESVRTAYGGEEALREFDEEVDVVLLDRHMPDRSGDEVLAELRRRDADARVAMVTAVDPGFDVLEMGFDAYVTKPVDGDELRRLVDELHALSQYDDVVRERFAVAQKRAAIEAEKSERELAESDEYDRLCDRATELDALSSSLVDGMDGEAFSKAVAGPGSDRQSDA